MSDEDEAGTRPRPRPRPTPAKPADAVRLAKLASPADELRREKQARRTTPAQTPRTPRAPGERSAWLLPASLVAGALVVLLVVLDLVLWDNYQDNKDDKAAADKRQNAAVSQTYKGALTAAKKLIPLVLTYDYKTIDADIERASAGLTGNFKKAYTQLLQQSVAPQAKSKKVSTKTTQVGASVINANDKSNSVSVLIFVDQETTTGTKKSVAGSRITVSMKKVGKDWLIAQLSPV